MRILVFSDSHGYTGNMVRAIEAGETPDLIIHLGDFVKDAVKMEAAYSSIPFSYVAGNNDWSGNCPTERILELEGRKILLTHGHHYGVKNGIHRIVDKGLQLGADAVLFGHTHKPEESYHNGLLLLNPGSISAPVAPNSPTYCSIEMGDQGFRVRFTAV